jgi:Ankyrin repeats (3 copies)
VRLLVASGGTATVNARESDTGCTPLLLAVGPHRSVELVRFLIESGAGVNEHNNRAETPLMLALELPLELPLLRLLLDAGATVDAVRDGCATALHKAAEQGCSAEVVCCLLKAGADATATNTEGLNAAGVAARCGHAATAALLQRAADDQWQNLSQQQQQQRLQLQEQRQVLWQYAEERRQQLQFRFASPLVTGVCEYESYSSIASSDAFSVIPDYAVGRRAADILNGSLECHYSSEEDYDSYDEQYLEGVCDVAAVHTGAESAAALVATADTTTTAAANSNSAGCTTAHNYTDTDLLAAVVNDGTFDELNTVHISGDNSTAITAEPVLRAATLKQQHLIYLMRQLIVQYPALIT